MLHVPIFKINIEGHTEGNGFIPLGAPFPRRCTRQDAGLEQLGSSVSRRRVRAPWGSAALPGAGLGRWGAGVLAGEEELCCVPGTRGEGGRGGS